MELSGFVSTALIEDLDTIELEEGGPYRIVAWGPGSLTWQRTVARSPYVHGEVLTGAVKDTPVLPLTIMIEGDSASDLMSNVADLLRAFEQIRYRVGVTVNDTDYQWYCQPADYAPNGDGTFTASHYREHFQVYDFRIPREPTPIQGPH